MLWGGRRTAVASPERWQDKGMTVSREGKGVAAYTGVVDRSCTEECPGKRSIEAVAKVRVVANKANCWMLGEAWMVLVFDELSGAETVTVLAFVVCHWSRR